MKNKWDELKKKRGLLVFLTCVFLILFLLLMSWIYIILTFPKKEIYFHEPFDKGLKQWEAIDAQCIKEKEKEGTINTRVKLSTKNYLAPHIHYDFDTEKSPPDSFVWRFQVHPKSFTGSSMTLGTLYFSTNPIVIIVNQKGQLGIGEHMLSTPIYSSFANKKVSKDKWQDIYVYMDAKKKKLTLYINDQKVFSKPYEDMTYPLKGIWLGCVWIKGTGDYGAPLDVSYDNITLGNKGLLPKPSFIKFTLNIIQSIMEFF